MDDKTRKIWAGLVNYANGTATTGEIRATIADCGGLVATTIIADIFDTAFMYDDLSKQVEAYRSPIDNLLRLLCSEPKSGERLRLRTAALEFLDEHRVHISSLVLREAYYFPRPYEEQYVRNLNYSPEELESFKRLILRIRDESRSLPFGVLIPSKGYRDLADPICDFLCSEYEKYLNREVSRKDKKAAPLIPIFVCPSCKKLAMPKRIGRRQYCSECSDRARTERYRQRASPDEGRDYAWLYRLRKLDSDTRRIRLRQPKVRQRLAEIKSRQKNSHRCQGLLLTLRL
jgi:hypothetical protein